MIQFDNIHKSYLNKQKRENKKVLDAVSFDCKDGQITALLGPNGAGKTTLIKVLSGLLQADEGKVSINKTQKKLGVFTDGFGLYPKLSAYENIQYFADLNNCSADDFKHQLNTLSTSLNLKDIIDKRADSLSQGEKMRVGLARALIHDPHYIILDEPTNGLDVMSVIELRKFLQQLVLPEHGSKCILYASHVMSEVEKLAHHIVILQHGKVIAQGDNKSIKVQTQTNDIESAFLNLIRAS